MQVFLITLDATEGAGATWTPTSMVDAGNPVLTDFADANQPLPIIVGQNGRILWAYDDATSAQAHVDYSDNDGLDWHHSVTFLLSGNEPVRAFFLAAMDIYMLRAASSGIQRTRNNGVDWEEIPSTNTATDMRAMIWDSSLDLLFAGEVGQVEARTVQMMHAPFDTGSWSDVSDGIAAATGFANNRLCSEGLERVKA